MSEPIKLLDAYRWFRGQSHQVDAVKWLDDNLPSDLRDEFGRQFRTQKADPSTTDLVQLELSWPAKRPYHTSGFRIFRLALVKEGKVLDKIPVLSGDLSTQKELFVRPEKDNGGSLRCLPEGIYSIARIQETSLMRAVSSESFSDSEDENSVGFERYWIGLEILPQYKVNNRGSFGIHAHANAYYKPGSAGSICPFNSSDMQKIVRWMEIKDRPTQLVCDLGTGFLKERSLLSILPPDEKRGLPVSNSKDVLATGLKFTLKWEGGKVDHPVDPGGRTNRGITQRTYDTFRKLQGLSSQDVFNATEQETINIYRELYWKPCKADRMILPLAIVHFDTAVLFGVGGAIEFLQEALGLEADGKFGTNTQAAFQGANNQNTAFKIIDGRIAYHKQRVQRSPSQRVFLQGWINRAEDLKKFIANL